MGGLDCCAIVDKKSFHFLHFNLIDGLILHTHLSFLCVAMGEQTCSYCMCASEARGRMSTLGLCAF